MALIASTHYSNYLAKIARFYEKKEVRVYTNLIFTIFATSFFTFFAIRPTLMTIAALNKELQDQKEVAKKLDQKIQDLSRAQQEYAKVRDKLYLAELALPPSPQPPIFLGQIGLLARENNLQIVSSQTKSILLRSTKNAPKSGVAKGNIAYPSSLTKLSLQGQYQGIESFLRSIDNLTTTLTCNKFDVSKGKKIINEQLGLSLEVETFYYPLGKETAS